MPRQCNIDAKGKMIRLIYGIVFALAGIVLMIAWAMRAGTWQAWAISLLLLISGLFAIYEARAGWCAVRAMGFKTRF
jgi:hypothetical protein